jgi:hypothetical protein
VRVAFTFIIFINLLQAQKRENLSSSLVNTKWLNSSYNCLRFDDSFIMPENYGQLHYYLNNDTLFAYANYISKTTKKEHSKYLIKKFVADSLLYLKHLYEENYLELYSDVSKFYHGSTLCKDSFHFQSACFTGLPAEQNFAINIDSTGIYYIYIASSIPKKWRPDHYLEKGLYRGQFSRIQLDSFVDLLKCSSLDLLPSYGKNAVGPPPEQIEFRYNNKIRTHRSTSFPNKLIPVYELLTRIKESAKHDTLNTLQFDTFPKLSSKIDNGIYNSLGSLPSLKIKFHNDSIFEIKEYSKLFADNLFHGYYCYSLNQDTLTAVYDCEKVKVVTSILKNKIDSIAIYFTIIDLFNNPTIDSKLYLRIYGDFLKAKLWLNNNASYIFPISDSSKLLKDNLWINYSGDIDLKLEVPMNKVFFIPNRQNTVKFLIRKVDSDTLIFKELYSGFPVVLKKEE